MLILSTQIPGNGGSATNAYNLLKILRKYNYKVAALFLEAPDKYKLDAYDPENVKGVFRTNRWNYLHNKYGYKFCKRDILNIKAVINKYLDGDPDVILCKNYVAPLNASLLYPNTTNIYLISGSKSLTLSKMSYKDLQTMSPSNMDKLRHNDEMEACQKSTYIIPNSLISSEVFSYVYPEYKDKILGVIDTSLFSITEQVNVNKQYDIAFVSSSFKRSIKGPELGLDIFSHPDLAKYNKIVIGDENEIFSDVSNITKIPLVPNTQVKDLLSRSRLLIVPSIFEASPNICTEAYSGNCKIISTLNVGNTEYHNSYYRVNNRENVSEWVEKICLILNNSENPSQYDYMMYYDNLCRFFKLLN